MKTYRRILSYGGSLIKIIPGYALIVSIAVVLDKTIILLFGPILEVLFKTSTPIKATTLDQFPTFELNQAYLTSVKEWSLGYLMSGESNAAILLKICVILLITSLLSNIFMFWSFSILARMKTSLVYNMRVAVYNKLLLFNISFFSNEKKGDIMSRMTNDVQEVEAMGTGSFNRMIKEPITIIITFVILFNISAKIMLFTLVILPTTGALIALITKRLRKKSMKSQGQLGGLLQILDETVSSLKIIQSFQAQSYFGKKFKVVNNLYRKTILKFEYSRALANPISQVTGMGVVLAILYFGGTLVLDNQGQQDVLQPNMFIIFILMFATVISPIKALADAISSVQRGLVAGERIFELIDADQPIKSNVDALPITNFENTISFENVSFSYGNKEVISNINLDITKGKSIALVGPSGGGKSTLIDLIPRFLEVSKGAIKIDGNDVRELDLNDIRKLIGTVTQESILFNDTVYNNIAFGTKATQEAIEEAAIAANAHEFIMNCEKGYDTEVGDRGMKLSGGQRQRLTIARAILKNPDILLLDEATSALDSESEHLVQEALSKLMKNRTSIVIAHRLSTIQHVDEIIVIEQGEIVERGNHRQLLSKQGVYFKLHNMQSFE